MRSGGPTAGDAGRICWVSTSAVAPSLVIERNLVTPETSILALRHKARHEPQLVGFAEKGAIGINAFLRRFLEIILIILLKMYQNLIYCTTILLTKLIISMHIQVHFVSACGLAFLFSGLDDVSSLKAPIHICMSR
jgi:hypothetical protein